MGEHDHSFLHYHSFTYVSLLNNESHTNKTTDTCIIFVVVRLVWSTFGKMICAWWHLSFLQPAFETFISKEMTYHFIPESPWYRSFMVGKQKDHSIREWCWFSERHDQNLNNIGWITLSFSWKFVYPSVRLHVDKNGIKKDKYSCSISLMLCSMHVGDTLINYLVSPFCQCTYASVKMIQQLCVCNASSSSCISLERVNVTQPMFW